jgi:4-methylaminobutanoate oxidase (formaldehyde-forming)
VTTANLPLTGGETILIGDRVVSLATSVGYGHTVEKTILRGYLDKIHWGERDFMLEVFGERYPITRVESPVYDPENAALKG